MGTPILPSNERLYQRQVTHTRDVLGTDGWPLLGEEGRVMTRDEAVADTFDGAADTVHGATDTTGYARVSVTTQP